MIKCGVKFLLIYKTRYDIRSFFDVPIPEYREYARGLLLYMPYYSVYL